MAGVPDCSVGQRRGPDADIPVRRRRGRL